MFIGRIREFDELNTIIEQRSAQFILVYGRRRVGKTTLLLNWSASTKRPTIYWMATRDTPAQIRNNFTRAIWKWAYPGNRTVPTFNSWEDVFEITADLIGNQPVILILDEFSYAAESDPSLPSNLQRAWDHLLKDTNITLILTGSHIGMMTGLMQYEAPLYGRFTGQLPIKPLPFADICSFVPHYNNEECIATYAIVGGIPAYLERFNSQESIGANLRRLFIRRTSMFRSEPFVLVGDVIRRETQTYESILKVIANGFHTPQEISQQLNLTASYLSPYFKQLEKLYLVERRIPATVPSVQRRKSRKSRYHLADPYLRFYFRFIATNLDLVEQELDELLWERIKEQFRAFVGLTAFEELCRTWVLQQARADKLSFQPELVGTHWDRQVQIDVVAINWRSRDILLGEAKWTEEPIRRRIVTELIEKTDKVVPNDGHNWHVHYAFFSRSGFTDAAAAEAHLHSSHLIDLDRLVNGL